MKIEILMQAQFWLALTREDLEPVFALSSHHYDSVCKAAGAPGGFLYGWRNLVSAHVPVEADPPLCPGSRRDLDTLLKICEGVRLATTCKLITPEQAERVNKLCALVWAAMAEGSKAVHDFKTIHVREPDGHAVQAWRLHQGRY